MNDRILDKRLKISIDEPETSQGVFEGTVLGDVNIDSLSYVTISVEKLRTWLAVRPRHQGDSIDEVLTGHEVIVNIGRPKDANLDLPLPGGTLALEQVEFYGIGSVRLLKD